MALAIFAQAAGVSVVASSRAQASTGQGEETQPPTDPLQPPQGDVVVDQTADRLVYQDPSTGETTARVFGGPVAYLDPTGAWKPLNNELQAAPAGGYVNATGPVHLSFARSSDATQLVQLTDGDNSVSFGLNGASQSPPTVSGDMITYPNASGGADLRYQVLAGRVKETLLLKQAPSGDGPVVYDFPLQTHGLTPEVAQDGSVILVDAKGTVDFSIPAGIAVDSSSTVPSTSSTSAVAVKLLGDAQSGWTIELQPDTTWLRSPDRVYPVYVDPSYTWTAGSGLVGSGGDDAEITNWYPTTNFDGSGQWNGTYYVDPVGNASFLLFDSVAHYDVSWLSGRSVSAATWNGYVDSISASPSNYRLRPAASAWTETGVTWNTQPTVISGYSASGSVSAASIWASQSITSWVQNWTNGTWTNNGILMDGNGTGGTILNFAADESSQSQRSYISVTYNSYPTTPNMRQPAPNYHTNQVTLQLSARVKDPDGGTLHGDFEIWSASTGGTLLYSGSGSTVSSGSRSTWTTPTLTNGTTYWWDVRGDDASLQSAYTTRRSVKIDTTPPATPGISSSTYTSGTWSSATSGPFTFTNGGSSDVVGWYYDFDNQNPTANNTTSGTPTIAAPSGWRELDVRSYDAAGNLSPLATFTYGVTPGGIIGIADGDRTQKRVTISGDASTTYDGFRIDYRRADNEGWTTVPTADVGISSWPVTMTGSPRRTSANLVWDVSTTLGGIDGPVQMRLAYYIAGVPQYAVSNTRTFTLDTTGFGSNYAEVPIGPGSLDPQSGNLKIGAADVATTSLTFSRLFNSRTPSASGGYLGAGWQASLINTAADYTKLVDNGDTVIVYSADGSTMSFYKDSGGTNYVPNVDAVGFTLTKPSSGRFVIVDSARVSTGFQVPSGGSDYVPFNVTQPGASGSTTINWQMSSGIAQPTAIFAPPAAGVSCSPIAAGCRELLFNYATTTTATGTGFFQWGNYVNQLQSIQYKAWNTELSTPAFTTDTAMDYAYDNAGHLRWALDPRDNIGTVYSYNSNGAISAVIPAGVNGWTLNYAAISGDVNPGRLSSVQRVHPTLGTATTTVVYNVPLSGTGAPYNLSASEASRWAQLTAPSTATAVFPPDEVPSGSPPADYNRATIYFEDANGRLVDVADPSPPGCSSDSGQCYISSYQYNQYGQTTRSLTAANRNRALNASASDGSASEAVLASQIDDQTVYSNDGLEIQDKYGPAHDVSQPAPQDDQMIRAREHTHYTYDQSAPVAANCPCHLVTSVTTGAMPLDGSADIDVHTGTQAFNIGSDISGWTLQQPMLTTSDPAGLDLVKTTLYDVNTGTLKEERTPAGPSGGDAHATLYIYYTAGTNAQDASCGNRPEYALLLCKKELAAQPGTSGLPDVPTTTYSSYNRYDLPLTVIDTSGTATRTTTYTYDSAMRRATKSVSSATGTSRPTITFGFDASTGMATTTSDGTSTLTQAFDANDNISSYTDAAGNATSYTYDIDGRQATQNDGKATQTTTYGASTERRDLATSIVDGDAGTFGATYDADRQIATVSYPGGIAANYTYDEAGELTELDYAYAGSVFLRVSAVYSINGQETTQASTLSSQSNSYNAVGRLTEVFDTPSGAGCDVRIYGFDSDSNRTSLTTRDPLSDGTCASSGGTTISRSFDAADRATLTGYAYDAFGRITSVPAADAPTGSTTTETYFTTGASRSVTVGSDTRTSTLDPLERVQQWTDSVDGQTRTNYYDNESDAPVWTAENTAGTLWTRNISPFGDLAEIESHPVSGSNTFALQLPDLDGNVIATLSVGASTFGVPTLETTEFGVPRALSSAARYAFGGAGLDSTDTMSGLVSSNLVPYNPNTGRLLSPSVSEKPAVPSSDTGEISARPNVRNDHFGCNSDVCIYVTSLNGHGDYILGVTIELDASKVLEGSCVPKGRKFLLYWGKTPATSSVLRYYTSTGLGCPTSRDFEFDRKVRDYWWFCGSIQYWSGFPCAQVLP